MPKPTPKMSTHPTVMAVRGNGRRTRPPVTLTNAGLRELCLDAGADDIGFVSIDDAALDVDREDALTALPGAKTLISVCVRTNRDNVRSAMRSIANHEFHEGYDEVNAVGREIVRRLEREGIRAVSPPAAFPQEMQRPPTTKIWVLSHKRIAVAAGLGHMGIHRCVIHPRFGSFILLDSILIEPGLDAYSRPVEFNPCLGCNLCVASCPVGAIEADGSFDMLTCYTHNYREFMTGFTDWVEEVVESEDAADYHRRVEDAETISLWQSLSYRPGYKAAYCVSVCPAGEDVIGPFLDDRPAHLRDVVRPLQDRAETVYVRPGSKAEAHVRRRFPRKTPKVVGRAVGPAPERSEGDS
jgi:NAD-dependent dihydropyrimidine dehydrogenase PreA subunit